MSKRLAPIDPALVPPPPNPELEHQLVQKDQHHHEMMGALETMIQQNDSNNPEKVLDASLLEQNKANEKLAEIADNTKPKDVQKIELVNTPDDLSKAFFSMLKGPKGDKGDQGEKGDTGENGQDGLDGKDLRLEDLTDEQRMSMKGEKGETGQPGRDGLNGRDGRDGLDGKDGLDGEDGEDGDKGDDGSPDTGVEIVQKISALKGNEQLSYHALKDTPPFRPPASRDYDFLELKDVPKSYQGKSGLLVKVKDDETGLIFGTIPPSISFVDNEIVSGNGTDWVLAALPSLGSEHIFAQRVRLYPGDYTISGKNITTILSYVTGDLLADYRL